MVRIIREWMETNSDQLKSETRYFITSLEREERSAAQLGQAIRGHWSVENKNHWKRDTSLWKEDASRPRKKASGGQVLALLRGPSCGFMTRKSSRLSTPASTTTAPNPGPPCVSSKLPHPKSINQTIALTNGLGT